MANLFDVLPNQVIQKIRGKATKVMVFQYILKKTIIEFAQIIEEF